MTSSCNHAQLYMRGRFDCSLRGYSHIRISKWRVPFLIQRSVQFLALFWAWRTSRFEKRSFIKRRRLTEYIKCVSVEQEDYMRTSSHLCDQKAVRKWSSAVITKLALSWKITRMWIDVGRLTGSFASGLHVSWRHVKTRTRSSAGELYQKILRRF